MSVRKREWVSPIGERRSAWAADYFDATGKRRQKSFKLKKDAERFLDQTRSELRAGTHTADSASKTVAEAGKLWLAACEANGLERTTIAAYEQHVRLHINPHLGRERLSQLTAPKLREFEDALREGRPAPGCKTGKPRSPVMVRRTLANLGALIADAQERGLVARNVVRDLRANRTRGKERRADRRQKGKLKVGEDIPSRNEIRAIVQALEGRWRPMILTAIFTGLRASELRGLRWSDVDLGRRVLHVRQRADAYNAIGRPKSESGERTVPLTPMVLNTLREWKLGCPKGPLDLVFPTSTGRIISHANIVQRGLGPALIAAGVTRKEMKDGKAVLVPRYPGLHALRHFYASWCINRKVDGGLELPAKVVQERMGHSAIAMTLDTYGHLFPSVDDTSELEIAERSLLG